MDMDRCCRVSLQLVVCEDTVMAAGGDGQRPKEENLVYKREGQLR